MKTTAIYKHRYATILFVALLVIMMLMGYATYATNESPEENENIIQPTLTILTNFKESNLSPNYDTKIITVGLLHIDDNNMISLVGTSSEEEIDLQPNVLNIYDLKDIDKNILQKNEIYIAILTGELSKYNDLYITDGDIKKIIKSPTKSDVQNLINTNLINKCTECIDKNILNCIGKYQLDSHSQINWDDTNDFSTLQINYLSTLTFGNNTQISITQDLLTNTYEIIGDYPISDCASNLPTTPIIYPTNDPKNEQIKINIIGNDENTTTYLNYKSN